MALRSGSLSRSLFSAARTLPTRSSPQPISLRPLISLPSTLGPLGCTHSLLPLYTAVASICLTSHIPVESRAFCKLSQGT